MKEILKNFIGRSQLGAVRSAMRGEEKQFFADLMDELAAKIEAMPKVYEQDGKGGAAIVHLHYFKGGMDWYILEKDNVPDEAQNQAFGYVDLGYGGELGYISIQELIENNVELDFYWKPVSLDEVKSKRAAA